MKMTSLTWALPFGWANIHISIHVAEGESAAEAIDTAIEALDLSRKSCRKHSAAKDAFVPSLPLLV
jgi:hypothetical protein